MGDWHKRRLAELEAKAPVKREKVKPFVYRLDLSEAAKAFAAMNCQKAMLWLWLRHQSRKTGNRTVAVPNGVLAKYGVPRETKRRALRELEAAGLITIEQRPRKTPLVTLL
jgi:Bacterial regulatory proteins, gntR family